MKKRLVFLAIFILLSYLVYSIDVSKLPTPPPLFEEPSDEIDEEPPEYEEPPEDILQDQDEIQLILQIDELNNRITELSNKIDAIEKKPAPLSKINYIILIIVILSFALSGFLVFWIIRKEIISKEVGIDETKVNQIINYVSPMVNRGADKNRIREQLINMGWDVKTIDEAFKRI